MDDTHTNHSNHDMDPGHRNHPDEEHHLNGMPESEHSSPHQREADGGHQGHVDHTGHEMMFRDRFWANLVLSIPVLLFSPTIQGWLGFSMPEFPGSQWITPLFAVIVFFYGGLPFLQMARPELENRRPGMMMLISLAISVAFLYSVYRAVPAHRRDLLLGAGHPDRYHAARPLAGDAQRAPGLRSPG